MNESQEKFKIRKEVAEKWLSVKKEETSVWVINALEKISNLKEFLESKIILVYAPQPKREIDFVASLMEIFPKKIYAFPRVVSDTKIDFFIVKKYQTLIRQKFGILSPPLNSVKLEDSPDFAVIPAVACDKNNNRLGRGAGFYDRYLQIQKNLFKLCILPDFAVYNFIPVEKWDQKVDEVFFIS